MWGLGIRIHGFQKLGVYLGVHVTGSMLFRDDASGILSRKLPYYHTKAQSLIRTNACGWQAGSWTNKGHGS